MEKDKGRHKLVYDYYETRILFGFYKYGDSLPSIAQICSDFHLGRRSVRTALAMLEKEGYIKNEERKQAVTVFQADSTQVAENMARYYVPRKEGILDFAKAGDYLFVPLWEGAMRRIGKESWKKMQYDLSNTTLDAMPLSLKFYVSVLAAWENRLVLNLLAEGLRYLRYPYLIEKKSSVLTSPELLNMKQDEAVSSLKSRIEDSDSCLRQELFDYIDQVSPKYDLGDQKPIPFRWNIYRQHPQMRYTLASLIIWEIMSKKIPAGSYLPSLPEMEQQYGVSRTTIRRTLALLEELGITRSFQGKGTQVWLEPGKIDFSKSEIREGMRLYQESLQLLALTIFQVSRLTLGSLPHRRWENLRKELEQIRTEKHSFFCFEVFFRFIRKECPLAAVRECYSKLAELVVWGYPFTMFQFKEERLDTVYAGRLKQMERHLEKEELTAFCEDWERLLEGEEQRSREFAWQMGEPKSV